MSTTAPPCNLPSGYTLRTGGLEIIDDIEALWLEQKAFHFALDTVNPEGVAAARFSARKQGLIDKHVSALVDIACCTQSGKAVGYCVSTINNRNAGEIESIFVNAAHRRQGLGKHLVHRALTWMDDNEAQPKRVFVLQNNAEATALYESFGFLPRQTELMIPSHANAESKA